MRIGLYTLHSAHNAGAMLQAFALTKVLQNAGVDVEIVNLYPKEEEDVNFHRRKNTIVKTLLRRIFLMFHPKIKTMEMKFEDFHNSLPLSKRYYSQDEYIVSPNQYDIHLVGSDQVWNLQKGFEHKKIYFLDYLPSSAIKISYASSLGTSTDTNDLDKFSNALSTFKAISVREDKALELVEELTNKKQTQVLDPTLLLNSGEWDSLISSEPKINGKYIFFYGVNRDEKSWKMLTYVKNKLNAKLVGYPGPLPPQYKFDEYVYDGGPIDFINLIKNAELVITSSYHGLAFSINYNKPVLLIMGERMERMQSLVHMFKMEKNIVKDVEDVKKALNASLISTHDSRKLLEYKRRESLQWLLDNIRSNY